MTALFNAPSALIGFFVGIVFMAFISGEIIRPLNKAIAEHNQIIAECEAVIPRNLSCELTAKVKE